MNIFENYKQDYGKENIDQLYIKCWNGIVNESIVNLIEITDFYFIGFEEEKSIDDEVDLFNIDSEFVISERLVNDSLYHKPIFSRIKNKGILYII